VEYKDKVLILTPLKNAEKFLEGYLKSIYELTYPHELLSIAFLESDSVDNTYSRMLTNLSALKKDFSSVSLWKKDFGFHIPSGTPRWVEYIQKERRSVLAKSRNHLLFHALTSEDWVLWLDVDIIEYPPNIIQHLLKSEKDIVQPHCVRKYGGKSFDLNAWRERGKYYMHDLRNEGDLVKLDSVGGSMLLVRADVHRDGLIFPPFLYGKTNPKVRKRYFSSMSQILSILINQVKTFHQNKVTRATKEIKKEDLLKIFEIRQVGQIETEGLGMMANDMGYQSWGMPNLEILHAPE
jgi:glycosyltransferase involved in cell wall biosynthesis